MAKTPQATQPLLSINFLPLPSNAPEQLLTRRPDIHAAEQQLIAANANIGVARANLWPRLSLKGLLGLQSANVADLLNNQALNWEASAELSGPIFDGGSRQAQVTISQTQRQAALTNYRYTIQTAFKEVLDALTEITSKQQQLTTHQRQIKALKQSLSLAQNRFDSGYSSYLEVLDAQRRLFAAQLEQLSQQLNYAKAQVKLYKALGGHWQTAKNNG